MRLGVLTGGGDAPGLNAAIRAVARRGFERGDEVIGFTNGWQGLLGGGDCIPLSPARVSGLLHLGGTILGTSRTNPLKRPGGVEEVLATLRAQRVDGLIAIGGDDTLSVAAALREAQAPVVGIPKTVDNDLVGTEYCIGFPTAVETVTDALDKLHTTASAHHRVLVVEVMGREAGWLALVGGLAGGADLILIPEVRVTLDEVCAHLERRRRDGSDYSVIVVAEGVEMPNLEDAGLAREQDEFGHTRLDRRNVGDTLSRQIEQRTKLETRVTVLGHIQRGGPPNAQDRVMATRLGVEAVDLVHAGRFGVMIGVQAGQPVAVDLADVVGKTRAVDVELYRVAQTFF